MNVEWFDGFDQYARPTSERVGVSSVMTDGAWAEVSQFMLLSRDYKRTGRASIGLSAVAGGMRRAFLDDQDHLVVGCGFYMTRLPKPPGNASRGATVIQQPRDENNRSQISIQVGPTGRVYILGGGLDRTSSTEGAGKPPELAKSRLQVAAGTWNYMEVKYHIAPAGSVEVRINGETFAQYTGNTAWAPGGGKAAQMAFGHFDPSIALEYEELYWDDIYVASGADADFRGDMEVHYLRPIADQDPQDWQRTSGGQSWPLINEIPPDGDVNYIFSDTEGDAAQFRVEALPVGVTAVAAVAPLAYVRKTESGPAAVSLGVASGVTTELSVDAHFLPTEYQYVFDVWEINPDTDGPWQPMDLPSIQIERTT